MKLNLSLILFILFAISSSGQTTLPVQDTRDQPTTPSSYSQSMAAHFKFGWSVGLPTENMNPYYTILGLRGWLEDNTGGKAHELAFSNDNQIYFRSGNSPIWEGWRKLLVSNANGSVGIGTTDTKGFKLAVAGPMIAESVKVQLQSQWTYPDYVFKPSYKLPSLSEVETYIKDNQHLPEIPSERDAKANGMDLGEMNAKLLKKIEELTLYVIEQNKKSESHQKQMDEYNKQLAELKVANDELRKELTSLKKK